MSTPAPTAPTPVPCPFCGDGEPTATESVPRLWSVACNSCGARGPVTFDLHGVAPTNLLSSDSAEQRAIDAWNRRARPRIPEFLSDALSQRDGVYRS